MLSAFGVDHGEISKGVKLKLVRTPKRVSTRGVRTKSGKRPTQAQMRTRGQPGAQTGPQKVKGALNRIGEADISIKGVGQGAGKVAGGFGGFLERHPGLAGTALVGGGGAAGYHYLKKEPKRR